MTRKKKQRTWQITEESAVVIQLAIEKRDGAMQMFNKAIAVARTLSDVPADVEDLHLELDKNLWIEKPSDG